MPKPRNESVDSVMIASPTTRVVFTAMGPTALGRRWRTMIRKLDAPDARAASTNSFSFSERNTPRTTRAIGIQNRAARMRMSAFFEPPKYFPAMSSTASDGTTSTRSVRRISRLSTMPPT